MINDTVIVAIFTIFFLIGCYLFIIKSCYTDLYEKILFGCLFGLTILGVFIQGVLAQL